MSKSVSSEHLRRLSNIDHDEALKEHKAAGRDPLIKHFSQRQGLGHLQEIFEARVRSAMMDFLYSGMKSLGHNTHDMDYTEQSPLYKEKDIKRLAQIMKGAFKKIGLPDDKDFWNKESTKEADDASVDIGDD